MSGQTTVEYILILSLAVMGTALITKQILNVLDTGVLRLGGAIERDLRTGRTTLRVYTN